MNPPHTLSIVLAASALTAIPTVPSHAGPHVTIETVTVGNSGNPGEQSRLPAGDPTFYGGVAYTYSIATYERQVDR
jgi:hypothetical protein